MLQEIDIQQEQERERRDQIVLEHLPLVRAIAVRVYENLPVHVDIDDLINAGILGLFDAATKYNPDKNVTFSSYAKHRIKGAILDSLRQSDWASRDLRRRHKQLEEVTRDLAASLNRKPTEEEVADRMGVSMQRWRQIVVDLRSVGLVSASARRTDDDEMPPLEFLADSSSQPDRICNREELRTVMQSAMKELPERYRKVVVMYYAEDMTMKEIGSFFGINESRVSQIHKSALGKMAVALEAAGITSAGLFEVHP